MLGIQPHFGPDNPAAVALTAGIIRTAAPVIERAGVATLEEIGVEAIRGLTRPDVMRAGDENRTRTVSLGSLCRWLTSTCRSRDLRPVGSHPAAARD
jgi:hypothetical protein